MIFCSIYIVWCTVSYLLSLFVCMYLCVTIDCAQFEGLQEQRFEDVSEQQQFFDEGKWSLIIIPVQITL
jgi:hypothetical protein